MTAAIELRGDGWTYVGGVAVRGQAFDNGNLLDAAAIARRFLRASREMNPLTSVIQTAVTLDGFYAAVISEREATTLVTDAARSIPLYYALDGSVVSDRGWVVRDAIGESRDPVAEREFILTRYVTGRDTIWSGVASMQPAEIVRIDGDHIERRQYWDYWPETPSTADATSLDKLRDGFETALDRLERVADGRPVVVPLSGGYDSRLIAAGLVSRGHDVVAFTFGRSGHPDVEVSREVADRLGIRWEFVPYSAAAWDDWYHGDACDHYRTWAFSGDALPFLAEWPAVTQLIEEARVSTDALFCPGHTVATPSERIPEFHQGSGDNAVGCGHRDAVGSDPIETTVSLLVDYVRDHHYTLWDWDDESFETVLRGRIRRGLLGGRPPTVIADPVTAAAAYERWEWAGRMTTFTTGDLRVYEDAGVDWWLPLWDAAYVRAWERVPLGDRQDKQLHAQLAMEYYRRACNASLERAGITDRSLSPFDRHLSLVRHTPVRQFTERRGDWDPPFLVPRLGWNVPGNHPLAWFGAVDPEILDNVPESCDFYGLRTLAATGRLDFADPAVGDRTEWPFSFPNCEN